MSVLLSLSKERTATLLLSLLKERAVTLLLRKSIKGEGSNTVVKSIKGEGSNAVVKQHDKQHKPNEIIDIESVQCTTLNDGPKPWLSFSHITLTIIDQDLIIQGKKLNDKHLNFAQAILKKQCAHLNGLHSTLFLF